MGGATTGYRRPGYSEAGTVGDHSRNHSHRTSMAIREGVFGPGADIQGVLEVDVVQIAEVPAQLHEPGGDLDTRKASPLP